MTEQATSSPEKLSNKRWNYTPPLPITQAPYCEWPLNILESVKYLFRAWSPLTERFFILMVAIISWLWFTPAMSRMETFSWDWMFEVWLRNLVIHTAVAGGLHLYLYTFRKQGNEMRFESKPLAKNSKVFNFNNQVWDNMFWCLVPGVLIWSLVECSMLWAYANGFATMITFTENPIWFVVVLFLAPFWAGFYFYWFHRALHVGMLYDRIHYIHHKNINVGPWSGHAMHPLEHLGLNADTFIYLLVASHPIHLQFSLLLHGIAAPTSHCGYDKIKVTDKIGIQLGDFMHQLHHKFFDCNYGTYETPWDKLFGSFHDGTEEGDRLIRERRRRLREKAAAKQA